MHNRRFISGVRSYAILLAVGCTQAPRLDATTANPVPAVQMRHAGGIRASAPGRQQLAASAGIPDTSLLHGFNVRVGSKAQEPWEIYGDLFYLKQAIEETSFPKSLKHKTSELVSQAQKDLHPVISDAKRPGEAEQIAAAGRIRRKLDNQLLKLLDAGQVGELNRRSVIVFSQEFTLAGATPGAFFEELARAADLRLTEVQQRRLEPVLKADYQRLARADIQRRSLDVLAELRQHIREALNSEQRGAWDKWALTALDSAAATEPASTQPSRVR